MGDSLEHRNSQSGLEVVPLSNLEAVPRPSESYPIPVHDPVITPYKDGDDEEVYKALAAGSDKKIEGTGRSRRNPFILIGAIAAAVIVAAAIVGGVLGSRASSGGGSNYGQTSGNDSSSPLVNNSSSPVVNTTAVRANTRLSVTGRRVAGNGFTSRLFWQGGDNQIRTSRYTSSGGTWSTPLVFDGLDAKPGTPIAATIYLAFPQFEVFYTDSSSIFRGINFGEDETLPKPDSIETTRPAFKVDWSRMSAYWPYVIYQNTSTTFTREVYGGLWFNDTMCGWANPADIPAGDNGTAIAVVPVVTEFRRPFAPGIAYRDKNGRLAIFSFGGVDTGMAWHYDAPHVSIPTGTSIGAFAVGRPGTYTTNTYILYQDDSHKIQVVWQDSDKWEGPREVGEADAGTDIACLTEQVGDVPSQSVLSDRIDMCRCYYQSGGEIKEKRLSSSGWIDGGRIPMQ
ncbi:hypothetical protein GGR54DRAFT_511345 [Hypoxylon sp. NC1633]|nr:hypothetical protein GGR54DRAFT_511345 [Hypoxylon sp. NC1633]